MKSEAAGADFSQGEIDTGAIAAEDRFLLAIVRELRVVGDDWRRGRLRQKINNDDNENEDCGYGGESDAGTRRRSGDDGVRAAGERGIEERLEGEGKIGSRLKPLRR